MQKVTLDRAAFLMPAPVTLLSSVAEDGSMDVMTVSWDGVWSGT